MCIVIPPGGENSTHTEQTVGFLREGRKPSGPATQRPGAENGAWQIPHRGVPGSAPSIACMARPAPSRCSCQAFAQSSGCSGSPSRRPALRRSDRIAIRW